MDTLIHILQLQAQKALKAVVDQDVLPEITPSTQPQFGHYQCNNALKLAKELKKILEKSLNKSSMSWKPDSAMISKMEIAGPGFINIFLTPEFLSSEINKVLHDARLGVPPPHPKERIIVEFSSPNIAKELHVGHLRFYNHRRLPCPRL